MTQGGFGFGEGPWLWLVVIDDGRDITFVPSAATAWLRALRGAVRARRGRQAWRLAMAYPWPKGVRTAEDAARRWAAEHREALVPLVPSNRPI